MRRLNVIGLETRLGYRTVELIEGDITNLERRADVLVLSAFAGGYVPTPGSVMGSLWKRHRISLVELAQRPAIDLRESLCIWLSQVIPTGPASRLMCVELIGTGERLGELMDNVFACLLLAEAKGIPTGMVAMPLLGTGLQNIDPNEITGLLIPKAKKYLERSYGTSEIQFVEIEENKAALISDAMDKQLGRAKVTLPQEQLVGALRADVRHLLIQSQSLFSGSAIRLYNDWIRLLDEPMVRSADFGVAARKLVELLLSDLEVPQQPLYKRIRALEERSTVAPWICGYMHVIRHLGNESAHEVTAGERRPSVVAPSDLTAGLFCVRRLLEFRLNEGTGG